MENVTNVDRGAVRSRLGHGVYSEDSFEQKLSTGVLSNASLDDEESRSVSEAGDIGDRALQSNRFSNCGSIHSFVDGDVHVISALDKCLELNNNQSCEGFTMHAGAAGSSFPLERRSSVPSIDVRTNIDKNEVSAQVFKSICKRSLFLTLCKM